MWNFLEVISYYDKLGTKKSYTQWIKHMNCTWMYNMEVFKRAPWKLAVSNGSMLKFLKSCVKCICKFCPTNKNEMKGELVGPADICTILR